MKIQRVTAQEWTPAEIELARKWTEQAFGLNDFSIHELDQAITRVGITDEEVRGRILQGWLRVEEVIWEVRHPGIRAWLNKWKSFRYAH